jgi:hypothetical protein
VDVKPCQSAGWSFELKPRPPRQGPEAPSVLALAAAVPAKAKRGKDVFDMLQLHQLP